MAGIRGLEAVAYGATVGWTTELASAYKSTDGNTFLYEDVVDQALVDRDAYHG
jgi:hypothetical protein